MWCKTDGSGLSRHDLVTPRAFVTLLQYAQKQPWFAPLLRIAAGRGHGWHAGRPHEKQIGGGQIHAKTGSVKHVRTLSGYADTPGGRRDVFVFEQQSGRERS